MNTSHRRSSVVLATRPGRAAFRARGRVRTTLGELVAAAFEVMGNRTPDVTRLLASSELGRAAQGRIMLVA
jgi:hypothetical protein